MFWYKAANTKLKKHHLSTVPARAVLFLVLFFMLTIYNLIMQSFDSSLNTNITFEHYHVGPRMAHFFKNMGAGATMSNHTLGNSHSTVGSMPLFDLESKLNPVFLEHGELNVKCNYRNEMNLMCYYIGVIKEPKYYIQEVTFNNTVPDVLPYKFELFDNYTPPRNYTNADTRSKLAAYFYIFENLSGQVHRYPTLENISQTIDFQLIRERVAVVYATVIKWTYISNYTFWFATISYALMHFMMLITRVCVTFLEMKNVGKEKTSDRFFKRLQNFSTVQAVVCFLYMIVHRLIVLLNGVVQSFAFSSLTEGITFNTTKSSIEGVSIFSYIFGFFTLAWFLAAFHHVTFKENLVLYFTPKDQDIDEEYAEDTAVPDTIDNESRVEAITKAIRTSMHV